MNPIRDVLRQHWRLVLGLVGLSFILAWAGGGCGEKIAPVRLETAPGRPLRDTDILYTARTEMVSTRVDVVGTVASEQKVHISARIPAHVAEVFVSAGDAVKKGQVLFTLDDREIREQLLAAEAQLKQAETEFQRTKQLFERNAATEQALTAAQSAYEAAKARVEQARVMLSYTQVTSPIDGIVTERRVQAGDLAAPGTLLTAVYDPTSMRLEVPVPLRLIDRLQLGQSVIVTIDRPEQFVTGQVAEVVSEVDPATRTQLVKVHLEGFRGEVLPGTFGRLWLEDESRPALLIPTSAVLRVAQLEMVKMVSSNRVVSRLVKAGSVFGDKIEITAGLRDGDVMLESPTED